MIDVEPQIRAALERLAPPETGENADWPDALRRSGARAGPRRPVVLALGLAGAALVLLATPLGSAVVRGVGGFSTWLTGEPGTRAPETVQRELAEADRRSWAAFPETPDVRELIQTEVDGASYTLHGFRSGNAVCLRLTVRGIPRTGPQLACAPVSELRATRDLIVPLKGNVGLGAVGPLPRDSGDTPTVPRAIAAFGLAADEVRAVTLVSDSGPRAALVGEGAFLHVLPRPARGTWVRRAVAVARDGRRQTVPIAVFAAAQPTGIPARKPRGPAGVDRIVAGGTIGWFVRREPRGAPFEGSQLGRFLPHNTIGQFARLVQPDPLDFLRMVVAENDLGERAGVCYYLVTRGGAGGTCASLDQLFRRGPLALTWGFSGAGQQFWIASGLASDDVARVAVFLATGERRRAPLKDNVLIVRLPAAKLPARIVGYDRAGRIVAVETVGSR
jgi:hypothetical protein